MTDEQTKALCIELSLIRKALEKLIIAVDKLGEPPDIRVDDSKLKGFE